MIAERKAVYFTIDSLEGGPMSTGKRTAFYHCWLVIKDADKSEIKGHPLSDRFWGRWPKCERVISKWETKVKKAKLERTI